MRQPHSTAPFVPLVPALTTATGGHQRLVKGRLAKPLLTYACRQLLKEMKRVSRDNPTDVDFVDAFQGV